MDYIVRYCINYTGILERVVDIQKLTYSALVLSMLFSTGEAVPLQYYGKLTNVAVFTVAAMKRTLWCAVSKD